MERPLWAPRGARRYSPKVDEDEEVLRRGGVTHALGKAFDRRPLEGEENLPPCVYDLSRPSFSSGGVPDGSREFLHVRCGRDHGLLRVGPGRGEPLDKEAVLRSELLVQVRRLASSIGVELGHRWSTDRTGEKDIKSLEALLQRALTSGVSGVPITGLLDLYERGLAAKKLSSARRDLADGPGLLRRTIGRLQSAETELTRSEALLCLQEGTLPRSNDSKESRRQKMKGLGGGTAVAECGRRDGGFGRGLRFLIRNAVSRLPLYLHPGSCPEPEDVRELLRLLCDVEVGSFRHRGSELGEGPSARGPGEKIYFGDLLGYQFELCCRRAFGQDARAPRALRFEVLLHLVEAGEKLRVLALPGILYSCWAKCVQFFLQGIFEDVVRTSNAQEEGLVAQTIDTLEHQGSLNEMLRRLPRETAECFAEFDGRQATDHMKAVHGFVGNLQLLEEETGLREMIRYGPNGLYGISLGVLLAVQPGSCAYIDAGKDLGSRPLSSRSLGRTGGAREGHVLLGGG